MARRSVSTKRKSTAGARRARTVARKATLAGVAARGKSRSTLSARGRVQCQDCRQSQARFCGDEPSPSEKHRRQGRTCTRLSLISVDLDFQSPPARIIRFSGGLFTFQAPTQPLLLSTALNYLIRLVIKILDH